MTNSNGLEGVSNNTVPIFQKAVGFAVETKRLGVRRKVSSSQIGTDADRSMIHVSKSILDSPELKKVEQLDGEVRRFLADFCLPSNFKSTRWSMSLLKPTESDGTKLRSDWVHYSVLRTTHQNRRLSRRSL